VDELAGAVTARVPTASSLLLVTVTLDDGSEAATLANALANVLVAYPSTSSTPRPASNIQVTIVDPAVAPASPDSRRTLIATGLGAAIGLIFTIGVAFAVESLWKGRVANRRPL
jgi:capsular polysaccharide biosynthesis protein